MFRGQQQHILQMAAQLFRLMVKQKRYGNTCLIVQPCMMLRLYICRNRCSEKSPKRDNQRNKLLITTGERKERRRGGSMLTPNCDAAVMDESGSFSDHGQLCLFPGGLPPGMAQYRRLASQGRPKDIIEKTVHGQKSRGCFDLFIWFEGRLHKVFQGSVMCCLLLPQTIGCFRLLRR